MQISGSGLGTLGGSSNNGNKIEDASRSAKGKREMIPEEHGT